MKENTTLTIASLLSILFLTLHVTDDILRGWEPGTGRDLVLVPLMVVWLYGTLVLAERRSGYIITLLFSFLSLVVPIIHVAVGRGVGDGTRVANTNGAFLFIWTLFALGVTGLFSVILSVRGLWRLQRGQPG